MCYLLKIITVFWTLLIFHLSAKLMVLVESMLQCQAAQTSHVENNTALFTCFGKINQANVLPALHLYCVWITVITRFYMELFKSSHSEVICFYDMAQSQNGSKCSFGVDDRKLQILGSTKFWKGLTSQNFQYMVIMVMTWKGMEATTKGHAKFKKEKKRTPHHHTPPKK